MKDGDRSRHGPLLSHSLQEHGFAIVPKVYSARELRLIAASLGEMESVGSRRLLDHSWCRNLGRTLRSRVAAELPQCARLSLIQATLFSKNDASNWFVGFHQDRSVPVKSETPKTQRGWSKKEGQVFVQAPDDLMAKMVALRLHLDDSLSSNGPLRVLPNSHDRGTLSRDQIAVIRNETEEVTLLASRGDVIALRPMLLHASSKSQSEGSRRVLQFLCAPKSAGRDLNWNWAH